MRLPSLYSYPINRPMVSYLFSKSVFKKRPPAPNLGGVVAHYTNSSPQNWGLGGDCTSNRVMSPLDPGERDALDEVTLREEEEDDHRHNYHGRGRHQERGLAAV